MESTTSAALASRIVARLREAGFQAFLVGGCVRDLLLGIPPKDFDAATDASPDQVSALFPASQRVGAHFGVALVVEHGARVEVATFRSDHAYEDGRHPARVAFESDPRRDVLRRDFTINALLMDPSTGKVLDYVGGRADLDARVVRAIGDAAERFREDHLRMLRAIRFAARLGFSIEESTFQAIRRCKNLIHRVSPERVRDELVRILTEGAARRGFELLDASGLLDEILPDVARMKGVEQPPRYHPEGDVWTHTLLLLGQLKNPTPSLALSALLHDVGKPPTFRRADRIRFDGHAALGAAITVRILNALRFSNDEIRRVESAVRNHMRFMDAPRMKESTLKRFFRLPHFEELLELHRIDCLASHGLLDNYHFVRSKLEELSAAGIHPAPLLTGDDLIRQGYTPGPRFKEILTAVEDAQLEGRLRTPEQALAFLRQHFPRE